MADLKLTYSAYSNPVPDDATLVGGFGELDTADPTVAHLLSLLDACRRFTRHARQQAATEAMRQIGLRTVPVEMERSRCAESVDEECERWDGLS